MLKFFIISFLIIGQSITVFGQSVAHDVQARFILKIVTHDKNMNRFGTPVKIGVTNPRVLKEFRKLASVKIKGNSFTVKPVSSPEDVKDFDILVIDKARNSDMKAYVKAAEENGVLTFGNKMELLKEGLAVSFIIKGGKPKIIVSKSNSEKQGTQFSGNFLGVCEVI